MCATGVILDPVYTLKGVRGMLCEMQVNPARFLGTRVLYIHTGMQQTSPLTLFDKVTFYSVYIIKRWLVVVQADFSLLPSLPPAFFHVINHNSSEFCNFIITLGKMAGWWRHHDGTRIWSVYYDNNGGL